MSASPSAGGAGEVELFQFAQSHFNEKVRWALDWKRVPHRRHSLLPGPHKLQMQWLSGQGQVPVLRDPASDPPIVTQSTRILEHLEKRFPEPALFPADGGEREEALALVAWLDAEVGPVVRRAKFFELATEPRYFAQMFSAGRPVLQAAAYRAIFPVVLRVMISQMDLHPEPAARALAATHAAFDRIAERARVSESEGRGGHLVGHRFSVADLSAAALLSPAVHPPGAPAFPKPYPPVLTQWLGRFADHPGAAWVRDIYTRYRGSSAELA